MNLETAEDRARKPAELPTPKTQEEYVSQRGGQPLEKDEWVLTLLGREYGLGGLTYRFPQSEGIVGMGQIAERRLGKMIGFDVPNQEHLGPVRLPPQTTEYISGKLQGSETMIAMAWALRAGHLNGLVRIQEEVGSALIEELILREQAPDMKLLYQIEACREGLSERLVSEIDYRILNPGFSGRGKLLFLRDQLCRQAEPVPVPQSMPNRTPLFDNSIPVAVNHIIPRYLEPLTIFSDVTTYDRASRWMQFQAPF